MMKYSCTVTANFKIFEGYFRAVLDGVMENITRISVCC